MAAPKSVWSIDIGQCALKALKLREINGELIIEAFDMIEHPKILSQPDADRNQLIQNALEQFLARNNTAGCIVAISVPGQSSFTRTVKLPPVEANKVSQLVQFEAEQQIPFPINEVIWRWQTFQDQDSPDVEVGLFAMKKQDVDASLAYFNDAELPVDVVQMAPVALYNCMKFDGQTSPDGATLLADVGADKTDLIVADGPRFWSRTIQIGGNSFTEALVKSFKLSFTKAEKLKRSAATSKYARQIFQAMRPIFAELVQEIQRSIGFYSSLHREARFKNLVGLGNGFRLPGLQKFFEQNLNIGIVRVDNYLRVKQNDVTSNTAFVENVPSFGVAYGLAVQALGLAPVDTNLLPTEIATKRLWKKKNPWFIASAAALVVALAGPFISARKDLAVLGDEQMLSQADVIVKKLLLIRDEYNKVKNAGQAEDKLCKKYLSLNADKNVWPMATNMVYQVIAEATKGSAQNVLTQICRSPSNSEQDNVKRDDLIKAYLDLKEEDRKIIYVNSISFKSLPATPASKKSGSRLVGITVNATTPLSIQKVNDLLADINQAITNIAGQPGLEKNIKLSGSAENLVGAAPTAGGPAADGSMSAGGASELVWQGDVEKAIVINLTLEIIGDGVEMPAK